MKHLMKLGVTLSVVALSSWSAAQESDDEPKRVAGLETPSKPTSEAEAKPDAVEEPASEEDGVRFRGGVAATGGGFIVSGFAAGVGGVDARLGVQVMDLLGIYVQPHLVMGAGDVAGVTAITGVAGASAAVDFTFIDQLFVGAGGGFAYLGQLNEPAPQLHVRLGGYPVVGDGEDGIRRKGLMIGADLHTYFVAGVVVIEPMLGIGYEAF